MKLSSPDEILNATVSDFTHKPVPIPKKIQLEIDEAEEVLFASFSEEQKNLFDAYRLTYLGVFPYKPTHFSRKVFAWDLCL